MTVAVAASLPLSCARAPPATHDSGATATASGSAPRRARDSRELDSAAPPGSTPRLRPLDAPWVERLELPDRGLAYVTPPVGATERRPVVVAVHGAVDDPGLACSAWRLIVDAFAFVVCPAGRPAGRDSDDRTFVWSSSDHIAKRVREAVRAVHARYDEHVAKDAPIVYAAFSQGANMAGPVLAGDPGSFRRAVLTEGGYRAFEGVDGARFARAFGAVGRARVLFTCSQPGCARLFAASTAALERAGVGVRTEYSGPHGHGMPPPVRASIRAAFPWVVDELDGWSGYSAAPKLPQP